MAIVKSKLLKQLSNNYPNFLKKDLEKFTNIILNEIKRALQEKNEFAIKENLNMYIETQFCFEAEMVLAWEKKAREDGNQLPIRIGIPGPATIKTLFRFAQISGIGPSMRFIAKQAGNVAKLMTVQSPHLLLAGLAED